MIEYFFNCPHCWQNQIKVIDPSIEVQNFIEDCEICCNPLEFKIKLENDFIESFSVDSLDQ